MRPDQARGGVLGIFPVLFSSDFGTWLLGFLVLLPEAKSVFYWNLFFKS